MRHPPARPLRYGAAAALLLIAVACGGGTAPPPQPGEMLGTPPDLRGRRVVLLPVQIVRGVPGDADAELAYALKDRGREIDWVEPDEIDAALARSPGLDADTHGLPVGVFLGAEVRRIGDPLYGQLRRISALVDSEIVLLPVAVTWEANQNVIGATPKVRLTMALIASRTGNVLWFGVEEGGDYPADDPRALASAVERMTRTLLWYAE